MDAGTTTNEQRQRLAIFRDWLADLEPAHADYNEVSAVVKMLESEISS